MNNWPPKDPNEVLDYQFDWTDRLQVGETIVTSDFILAEGTVTIGSETFVGALCTVWLSGGTEGSINILTNRITTSVGRTYDESAKLKIRTK